MNGVDTEADDASGTVEAADTLRAMLLNRI